MGQERPTFTDKGVILMKELHELTTDDLNPEGCLRLMLELLWVKVEAKDEAWIKSDQCLRTLGLIPSKLLPQAIVEIIGHTQLVSLSEAVSPQVLQTLLLKRIDTKEKLRRDFTETWKKRPQKRWAVTSPDGITEIITSIKKYAEKEGICRQGLTNAQRVNVQSYKGYKIRRF